MSCFDLQLIVFVGKMTVDELLSICICMNYYGQWFHYFYITVIKFLGAKAPLGLTSVSK
jgi:hypothetical protein